MAAGEEQPPVSMSPFTGSISHAGPEVRRDDRVEPMLREHGIDAVRTRRLETGLARFEVLGAVEVALGVGLSQSS